MSNDTKKEMNAVGDLWLELEETKKTDCISVEEGPYSVTYAFGGLLSIICC